jgi:ubiquinone/menaquinone biosynthesis C-methylase UbiE
MSSQIPHAMPAAERLRRAGSFGAVASEYERGRPGYPSKAIDWILGAEPLDVLDLGAGTGKLTEALLAAGHRVIAVEPLTEMRVLLQSRLPGAEVMAGRAEQLPLDGESVDGVVVGAAFHWFDQEQALAEIRRVLRPPGVLALLGNAFDSSVDWQAELRQILGSPTLGRAGHWPDPERLLRDYSELEEREFEHSQPITLARLRDYASSRSSFATLEPPERESRLAEIDRLWARRPELGDAREVTLRWIARVGRCRGLR